MPMHQAAAVSQRDDRKRERCGAVREGVVRRARPVQPRLEAGRARTSAMPATERKPAAASAERAWIAPASATAPSAQGAPTKARAAPASTCAAGAKRAGSQTDAACIATAAPTAAGGARQAPPERTSRACTPPGPGRGKGPGLRARRPRSEPRRRGVRRPCRRDCGRERARRRPRSAAATQKRDRSVAARDGAQREPGKNKRRAFEQGAGRRCQHSARRGDGQRGARRQRERCPYTDSYDGVHGV